MVMVIILTLCTNSVVPEPEGSSPYTQEPSTGPSYPETTKSTPHPQASLH
jgi:hypothetical protein